MNARDTLALAPVVIEALIASAVQAPDVWCADCYRTLRNGEDCPLCGGPRVERQQA